MNGWIDFALERYNYWIFIVLMMIGLYIVFARANLVKKLVGLNIFQTSVFIYYISIGKIAGGTAPIYVDGELEKAAAAHGGGHGEEHGDGSLHETPDGHDANTLGGAGAHHAEADAGALHAKISNAFPENDMKAALEAAPPAEGADIHGLHAAPSDDVLAKIGNEALSAADKRPPAPQFELAEPAASLHAGDHANTMVDALNGGYPDVVQTVYTNPLPHVLILTAIVVGVATTAVGLALAVRIREAYGSIEEDELEAADDIAEFGHAPGAPKAGAAS